MIDDLLFAVKPCGYTWKDQRFHFQTHLQADKEPKAHFIK